MLCAFVLKHVQQRITLFILSMNLLKAFSCNKEAKSCKSHTKNQFTLLWSQDREQFVTIEMPKFYLLTLIIIMLNRKQ